jgi:hypothetical protein
MISALLGCYVPGVSVSDALAATASTTSLVQSGTTSTITTGSVTATVTGGTPPYSYAWTQVGANPGSIQPLSATSAATVFRKAAIASGDTWDAIFKGVVTDALGQTASTANVLVEISRT